MFGKLRKEEVSVLYQITNLSPQGSEYFKLDSHDYSLFPYEQEVLFRSGSLFDIVDISEEVDEKTDLTYFLVTLKQFDSMQALID